MTAHLIFFGVIALAFVLIFAFIHALNKINERAADEHRQHCTKLAVEAFEPSDALLRLRALREKQRRGDPPKRTVPASDSVDLSQPLSTILYDAGPSYATPIYSASERCDSSIFSDSSYSCDSGSSSGGGE